MPNKKAEQYLKDVMNNYRNKLTYDSATGEIQDVTRHLSMIEDFWMARKNDGKNTEITTLPAGQNLGQMEDVLYFEKKLYRALGVPVSRLEPSQGFSLGRSNEITRDEIKFDKFVTRLRARFAVLFDELMGRQLALKAVMTLDEWKEMKEYVRYDFIKDNNFAELKDQELWKSRVELLTQIDPFIGRFVSKHWVQENVLMFDEEEIKEVEKEMKKENEQMMKEVAQNPALAAGGLNPGAQPQTGEGGEGTPPTSDPNQLAALIKTNLTP